MKSLILLSTFFAVSFAPTLRADMLWNWSYTSNIYTGSGTFVTQSNTTTSGSFTGYLITSMTGIFNGSQVTGVSTLGSFGGNDNLLAASLPQLDGSGLTFTTTADQFNMFYNGSYVTFGVSGPQDTGGTFSATAAPEPSTIFLIPPALLLCAGYGWRKRRAARPAEPFSFRQHEEDAAVVLATRSGRSIEVAGGIA